MSAPRAQRAAIERFPFPKDKDGNVSIENVIKTQEARIFYEMGYKQAEADALALLERLRADAEKRDLNIEAQCGYHIALDAVELLIKEGQR